jgi:hypothetical protein
VKLDICEPNPQQSYTQTLQKQVPSSFCFYFVSATGALFEPVKYTALGNEEIGLLFNEKLIEYAHMIHDKYEKTLRLMHLTHEDQIILDDATVSYICEAPLITREMCRDELSYTVVEFKKLNKIADHCHITGKFRGAAHNCFNQSYQLPEFHPVVLHDLAGYDAHLFVRQLKGNLKCMLNTDEKSISFSSKVMMGCSTDKAGKKIVIKRDQRFIDSLIFIPASLDALLKNLQSYPKFDQYVIFNDEFVTVHMKTTKVVNNKPIYLGMRILELCKTLMYELHCAYIKPNTATG